MDSKLYPQGKAPHYTKYVNGVLKFFKRSSGAEMFAIDGNNGVVYKAGEQRVWRVRATAAEVNAGTKEVLAAVPGYKIQITDVTLIAIGGNAGTATSVDIVTTQSGSAVRPIVAAVAALTRSAVVKPNSANVTVLADGASFAPNDANTAVLVSKQSGGGALDTATHIDVIISYVLVRA